MRTRTNIEIDDRLMRRAMRTGRGRTKRAVVEAGLRLLVQTHAQAGIRRVKGKGPLGSDLSSAPQGDRARKIEGSFSPPPPVVINCTAPQNPHGRGRPPNP